ncbi:uncharacterized protein LOC130405027 isoform X1 [Gadus chalcogrammus]|uniref:uncharacterized protein LOC130405027 isoform X1 n=1 Tax=Gadus chalcogrammus TaxID=1042646 RepID=UPI0024C3DBD4|nr:uncharacterized protein LOC130405027 isoform X1 [Gadus chalcogrammus]
MTTLAQMDVRNVTLEMMRTCTRLFSRKTRRDERVSESHPSSTETVDQIDTIPPGPAPTPGPAAVGAAPAAGHGGGWTLSVILCVNILILGAALISCSAVNGAAVTPVHRQIFLIVLLSLTILWMLFYTIFTRRAVSSKDSHAGPLWLRVGLVLFGLLSLIMDMFMIANYSGRLHCDSPVKVAFPCIQAVFIFFQTYFLWIHAKDCVQLHKDLTRCGLTVTLSCNLVLWMSAVVEEYNHHTDAPENLTVRSIQRGSLHQPPPSQLRRPQVQVQLHLVRRLQGGVLLPVPLQHRVQPLRLRHGLRHVEERGPAGRGARPPAAQVPGEGRERGARGGDPAGADRPGHLHRVRDAGGGGGAEEHGAADPLHHQHRHREPDVRLHGGGLPALLPGPEAPREGGQPHPRTGRGAAGGGLHGPAGHQLLQRGGAGGRGRRGPRQQPEPGLGRADGGAAGHAEPLRHRGAPPGALPGEPRPGNGGQWDGPEPRQEAPETELLPGCLPTRHQLEAAPAEGDLCLCAAGQHHPLDHACVRGTAPVRPDRRDPFLRLHHVGSHCEHRTALWDLLPHALGGQPVRGVPHRLTQVRL